MALIRELEEQYKIELRKKAILKNQCDQAYLRGASAISLEALRMSQSSLNELYAGVKMPQFEGNNLLSQIRLMQESSATVVQKTIVEKHTRKSESAFDQSFGQNK